MHRPFIPGWGLAAVLMTAALASCSGDEDGTTPEADGGIIERDSGLPPEDSGTPDAGGGEDAGDAGEDAGSDEDAGTPDAGDAGPGDGTVAIPNALSGFGLFTGTPAEGGLQPVEGNIPYALTTPLFSDYSVKSRTLYIPPGAQARYSANDVLDLPVGTIITKTFAFPADLRAPEENVRVIETRVLVRQPGGWEAHPYFWNEAQTEATLANGGRVVRDVRFIGEDGVERTLDYLVPSKNQCLKCHHLQDAQENQVMVPIGVKARYLNRDHDYGGEAINQLQHLANLGRLTGLPPVEQVPRAPDAFNEAEASLEARARTYLDINCAHCHNPKGTAGNTSRLFLNVENSDAFTLGVCKRPGSAGGGVGGEFDIVPGSHSTSILWYRMDTEESGKMMPELGRALRHDQGSRLIADWIDAMPPQSCK
ncbi:SO2930 family diheme c-type cytochrome [Myxococcus sp. Y35]|uniref:SO2930 family diheme c-type cytochrome n=1 Tax=Pseudomyxococcus flavus TaxID=3115648 RepID=UPI003CFB3D06